jgi:thiosulfate dehydrogenase [quinone] large subunit
LLSQWAILPLRLFLGVTFVYAGLQKIANPNFFNGNNPNSILSSMVGSEAGSPLHFLVAHLLSHASWVGWFMALGELAVGLGTLLGLWGRIAALGGFLISLSLFLTITWHSHPWFTGADIVYCFAWTTILIAGSGQLSLDGVIARRSAKEFGQTDPIYVPIAFDRVKTICGFNKGVHCSAVPGRVCAPGGCPYLEGEHQSIPVRRNVDAIDRRQLVRGGVATMIIGGAAAATASIVGAAGRAFHAKSASPVTTTTTSGSPTTTTTSGSTPQGVDVGAASSIPVNSSATFTVPSSGDPGLLICTGTNQFVAYDAICPHAGCTVNYFSSADIIACPCHGSEFDVATGAVVQGPALRGLTPLTVEEGPNGDLYVKG